jgi:hypothetical protein
MLGCLLRTLAAGALVAGAGALAAGCGSEPASPCDCGAAAEADAAVVQDGGPEAWTDAHEQEVLEFCDATFGMQAGLWPACCTEAERASEAYQFLQGIPATFAYECRFRLTFSAAQGRIVLDAQAAVSCAQAFQQVHAERGCDMLWTGIDWEGSSCRDTVKGLQQDGEACRYRYECRDGLTCYGNGPGLDGTCGPPQAGGACRELEWILAADQLLDAMMGRHSGCAEGLTCLHTNGVVGVCARPAEAGEPCAWDAECKQGLRCQLGLCSGEGPGAEGAPCRVAADCVPRLYCELPDGGAQGSCAARRPAGAPCSILIDVCRGLCVPDSGGELGMCIEFCSSG